MIVNAVAIEHGISPAWIRDKSMRVWHDSHPRMEAWYLIRTLLPLWTYATIGRYFGGMDHTTVMHGIRKTMKLMETDADLVERLHDIELQMRDRIAAMTARMESEG
jgi:chromosomal replication initiator protein